MNKTFTNIIAAFLTTLVISCVCALIYFLANVMGIKSPELVVFAVLTVTLALEYKGKIFKDNE